MMQPTPIGFYKAPTTKVLIFLFISISIIFSIFRIQHYLHLQLKPHLTKYLQYWRIITCQIGFMNSGETFLTTLLLYQFRIIERLFGVKKYLSFITYSFFLSSILQLLLLILLEPFNFKSFPTGPYSILFSLIFLYYNLIPVSYKFKIFYFEVTDKTLTYVITLQLLTLKFPYSILSGLCGIIIGVLYYYNFFGIKSWRYPKSITKLVGPYLDKWLTSSPTPRGTGAIRHLTNSEDQRPSSTISGESDVLPPANISMVRETFNSFNSNNDDIAVDNRTVELLQGMFPNYTRETLIRTLANHEGDVNLTIAALLRL